MTKKTETLGVKPKVTKETNLRVEQYNYCFNLIENETGVKIAVARTVVSDKIFKNMEAAKAYIDSKPWSLIMAAAHVCMKIFEEQSK